MTIRLHCFAESGNAYKAALALELAGLDWEPVFVDFFHGAGRGHEFREGLNEMGEVPVMEDGDLRGIVSIGDVVNACRRDAERENRHLKDYIRGEVR